MKKVVVFISALILIPLLSLSQTIEDVDYISPFHEGYSAIKKGNQWAFINTEGTVVVDFRDDLVVTKSEDGNHPVFNDGRCLMIQKREDIPYYGYIDTSGKTVIEPQFLNATNFKNNAAIALELIKEEAGQNKVLGKNIVYYRYFEVVIDDKGEIKTYLNKKGTSINLDKKYLIVPPEINSKLISEKLAIVKSDRRSWSIVKLN